jgi:small subunit ribosomal protein S17
MDKVVQMVDEKKTASEKVEEVRKQPSTSAAKKITKRTESAAEIEAVQSKKAIPVRKPEPEAVSKKGATVVKVRKVKKADAKDVGIDIPHPVRACTDRFCPYHGRLSVRGIQLDVQLVSRKMQNTVVVKRERRHYIQKYQRYEKRTTRMFAHMPPCIDADIGDMVRVMECRPLSKGTHMVVLGRI